nr:MAG TPA: hypothetical protein [Caudoviricetes sp.]
MPYNTSKFIEFLFTKYYSVTFKSFFSEHDNKIVFFEFY